jgi:hypothetical protein
MRQYGIADCSASVPMICTPTWSAVNPERPPSLLLEFLNRLAHLRRRLVLEVRGPDGASIGRLSGSELRDLDAALALVFGL